ncbi:MAG TPA: polyphenol oxidase family protein [Thermoanaerobaculia bacterium]|nr:polyphenol oxidase family protein [Thermoanaerobaculia bacterium]
MDLWSDRRGETIAAFSRRGEAPPETPSATAHLARRLAAALGRPALPIARATQVHGKGVLAVREPIPAGETRLVGEGDVLVTTRSDVALVVQTADCVPILLQASAGVAAIHAGWRGTAVRAAAEGVRALARECGEAPSAFRAVLGPAIGACCYEVGGEVAATFAGAFVRRECGGKFRLDLKSANRAQLEEEGILPGRIEVLPFCTHCGGAELASFRRDGPGAGRMIGLVARVSA